MFKARLYHHTNVVVNNNLKASCSFESLSLDKPLTKNVLRNKKLETQYSFHINLIDKYQQKTNPIIQTDEQECLVNNYLTGMFLYLCRHRLV